ncbi:MAG TPA: hypothetical protein VGS16_05525 [Candidatus Dormibacteraeota bacterium]|nr:hypothetical protein [Candidatus Dormibacteraeota bacterium]
MKGVKAINKSQSISPLCAPPYGDFRNCRSNAWATSIARELEHIATSHKAAHSATE